MLTRLITTFLLLTAFAPIRVPACTLLTPPPTDAVNFEKASSVFVAHVVTTEELRDATTGSSEPKPTIQATLRIIEVLKGHAFAGNTVQAAFPAYGNCSLFLLAGFDYLFFVGNDNLVVSTSGSRPISPLDADAKALLERLRKLQAGGDRKP